MLDAATLAFLAPCFVASLILTGIHAYLGVHVVERGVIFVDLSLAQIAALGGTIALLMPMSGGDPHAPVVYWISLGVHVPRRAGVLDHPQPARAHPAGGDHRHLLRGGVGGVDSGDEQGDLGRRAPEGHAGREHPRRLVGGGREDGAALRRGRRVPLRLPPPVLRHLARSPRGGTRGGAGAVGAAVGLSLLRVVRLRRHLVGVDCRRAARLLLSHRAVGRGDALRRFDRQAAGDRLVDGHARVGARRLPLAQARPADRRDDRLHVRARADYHGGTCAR